MLSVTPRRLGVTDGDRTHVSWITARRAFHCATVTIVGDLGIEPSTARFQSGHAPLYTYPL